MSPIVRAGLFKFAVWCAASLIGTVFGLLIVGAINGAYVSVDAVIAGVHAVTCLGVLVAIAEYRKLRYGP